eukprot:76095_1
MTSFKSISLVHYITFWLLTVFISSNPRAETCTLGRQCPISNPGSYPLCGREDTGAGTTILCAGESPNMFGGSFDFNQAMGGTIYRIATTTNRNNYCSQPTGVGGTSFHVHCGCGGGCLIEGDWTVFWNATYMKQ